MATTRNLYKRKAGEFEQVRANKRLKLSWPTGIVRSIDTRLRTGISDIKSAYFFRQTVSLLHAAGVDTSWRVDRFLGSGGYGIVALWVQQDDDGNILDEIAIKDDRIVSRVVQDLDDPLSQEKDYSQEALLQSVVNSRNPDNVLHLRKFINILRHKISYGDPRYEVRLVPRIFRYYFEYAPYGDLYGLQLRYKTFNQYLPELFLWHVFDSLVHALEALQWASDERPWPSVEYDHILHLDIKPHNVLLGYEKQRHYHRVGGIESDVIKSFRLENDIDEKDMPIYPSIKLADFGLGRFSSRKYPLNAERLKGWATPGYMPPEQLRLKNRLEPGVGATNTWYGGDWTVPPHNAPDRTPAQSFAMNVWAIGKVMFDLASLSNSKDFTAAQAPTEDEYWNQNTGSMLEDFDKVPFKNNLLNSGLAARAPYPELMRLIQSCMEANADDRNDLSALRSETTEGLKKCLQAHLKNPFDRVHYINNADANQLAGKPTQNNFLFEAGELQEVLVPGRNDPDDEDLNVDEDRVIKQPTRGEASAITRLRVDQAKLVAQNLLRDEFRRAWMRDRRLVQERGGEFIFTDNLTHLPDELSEDPSDIDNGGRSNDESDDDDDSDDDNAAEALVINFSGHTGKHTLDLGSDPQPPPPAYEMFADFVRPAQPAEVSDAEMRAEWDTLPQEHQEVFGRAYEQALNYYDRYSGLYDTRPQKQALQPLAADKLPKNWRYMNVQARERWQHENDKQRRRELNRKYKRALRAWQRRARRKNKMLEESPRFLTFLEKWHTNNGIQADQSFGSLSASSKVLELGSIWRRLGAQERADLRLRYARWVERQLPATAEQNSDRAIQQGSDRQEGSVDQNRASLLIPSPADVPLSGFFVPGGGQYQPNLNQAAQPTLQQQSPVQQEANSQDRPGSEDQQTVNPDPQAQAQQAQAALNQLQQMNALQPQIPQVVQQQQADPLQQPTVQQPTLQNVPQPPALPPVPTVIVPPRPAGHYPTLNWPERKKKKTEAEKLAIQGWNNPTGKRNGRR